MRSVVAVVTLYCMLSACSDGAPVMTSSTLSDQSALVTTCSGAISTGTHENVKVPAGSSCTLQGVTVKGNVVALENARLTIDNSTINGNVQGEKAAAVHISGGTIGGNIQIQDGWSPGELGVSITGGVRLSNGSIQVTKMATGRIVIADAIVEKGSLQLEENSVSEAVEILRNRVAQNLEFRKHLSSAAKTVSENLVGQKLECKENSPPFTAAANSAVDHHCPS